MRDRYYAASVSLVFYIWVTMYAHKVKAKRWRWERVIR